MLYHKTKSLMHVKEKLGHRSMFSTTIYTHLVNFESDKYPVAHAETLKEEDELTEAGFEFIRYNNEEMVAVCRKQK